MPQKLVGRWTKQFVGVDTLVQEVPEVARETVRNGGRDVQFPATETQHQHPLSTELLLIT